jgi:hypothetical protein
MRLFISPDISAPGGEAYDESLCVGIPFIDNVKASNSIGQVKEMIEDKFGMPANRQVITFCHHGWLVDTPMLSYRRDHPENRMFGYGIMHRSILCVKLRAEVTAPRTSAPSTSAADTKGAATKRKTEHADPNTWGAFPDQCWPALLLVGQFLGGPGLGALSRKYRRTAPPVAGLYFSGCVGRCKNSGSSKADSVSAAYPGVFNAGGPCVRGVLCALPFRGSGQDAEHLHALPPSVAAQIQLVHMALCMTYPYRLPIPAMKDPVHCPQGHAVQELNSYEVQELQPRSCSKQVCSCGLQVLAAPEVQDNRGFCSTCSARIGCYPSNSTPAAAPDGRVLMCDQCDWRLCALCSLKVITPILKPVTFGIALSNLRVLHLTFQAEGTNPSCDERSSLPATLMSLVQNTGSTLLELDVTANIYFGFSDSLALVRSVGPALQKFRLFNLPWYGLKKGRLLDRSATLVAELSKLRPELAASADLTAKQWLGRQDGPQFHNPYIADPYELMQLSPIMFPLPAQETDVLKDIHRYEY